MNKICTSIEQSKKLIELGIDINTADMYWSLTNQNHPPVIGKYCAEYGGMQLPAWSLSALMELMNRNCYNISLNCHGAEWNVKFDDSEKYKDFTKDYAIDAAFEMICWLKRERNI